MKSLIFLCILSIAASAQSGTKARPKSKPAPVAATPRISHYMQEMGLMYVESIEERNDCRKKAENFSDCDHYDKLFDHMRDELEINLTKRTDKDFAWVLHMAEMLSDPMYFKAERTKWEWGISCLILSRDIAKSGDFDVSVGTVKCTSEGLEQYLRSKPPSAAPQMNQP